MSDAFRDSFNQFANKKQQILSRLADTHEERIINTLKNLEDEIIADLTRLTDGGVKLNTQLAIQLRPNLKTLIEQNFLKEADGIVSEYDEIVKEYQRFIKPLPIPEQFKTLTKPDLRVINELKILSFSGFEDVGNRFLDTIANEVYQSSVTGRPFNEMVKNIRGQISGVYQRSNENAVNRLVDYIDKNRYSENAQIIAKVKNAREILHTKYASDILGNNMRRYAGQIAQDSLMQFDGQFTLYKGKEAGITKYQYVGTNITTTRDFCRRYVNRVFTEEEAREIWQGSWRGKSGTDPFVNRGGYRCRHSFILYDDDWFTEETNDNIKEQEKTTKTKIPSNTKTVNKSSLKNKITADKLQPISTGFLISKLNREFTKNNNDKRYPTFGDKKQHRFRGRDNSTYGKALLPDGFNETDFAMIEALMQELDELAIKYNVPKLRGITKTRIYVADMGDGTLGLNPKYVKLDKQGTSLSTWKRGDDVFERPFTADAFFSDPLDKVRTTFYHEFGHHIHQIKFVDGDRASYLSPKLEKLLGTVKVKSRKYEDGRVRVFSSSPTKYGDKNNKEWFVENFTLYELGRKDLVDPKFIKFFEENVL